MAVPVIALGNMALKENGTRSIAFNRTKRLLSLPSCKKIVAGVRASGVLVKAAARFVPGKDIAQ